MQTHLRCCPGKQWLWLEQRPLQEQEQPSGQAARRGHTELKHSALGASAQTTVRSGSRHCKQWPGLKARGHSRGRSSPQALHWNRLWCTGVSQGNIDLTEQA